MNEGHKKTETLSASTTRPASLHAGLTSRDEEIERSTKPEIIKEGGNRRRKKN